MELGELEQRVQNLIQESKDVNFTRYLLQVQQRLNGQKHQLHMLQEEVEGNYRLYQSNMRALGQPVPQEPVRRETPAQAEGTQPASLPVPQPAPAYYYQAVPQPPERKRKNTEFAVGAALLSIVGGAFILIALILVGVYFMNDLVQGIGMYVLSLLVIAFAELFLYSRLQKLGMTISAIGMGGLYISTMLNYFVMENFGRWTAMGVTFLITLGVVVLSRKRAFVLYRILGVAAVYICMFALYLGAERSYTGLEDRDVFALTGMLLLINIVCFAVPMKKARTAVSVTHLLIHGFFSLLIVFFGAKVQSELGSGGLWVYPIFMAVSVFITQMIYVLQVRWELRQKPDGTMWDNFGICMAYGISILMYMLMTASAALSSEWDFAALGLDGNSWYRLICTGVTLILCLVPFCFLRRRQEKWLSGYFLYSVVATLFVSTAGDWQIAVCMGILLMFLKLLSFRKLPVLRPGDAILTTYVCLCVLMEYKERYMIPLFAVLVFSALCINYWKAYFETVLTLTIALYTSLYMLSALKLPVFVGILFVGMLLFNNIKRWQGRDILVYNGIMLGGQGIAYLFLVNPVYQNAFLTYLCMLIFGVTTIVVCFQENYHMAFRVKYMVLSVFLTYMALVIRTNYAVTNSILLMLIALFAVGLGFASGRKSVRIYGLVLSLLVCGKIVLYDYLGAPAVQKTILFFVVGVLALAIAAIYMILEKKAGKRPAQEKEKIVT